MICFIKTSACQCLTTYSRWVRIFSSRTMIRVWPKQSKCLSRCWIACKTPSTMESSTSIAIDAPHFVLRVIKTRTLNNCYLCNDDVSVYLTLDQCYIVMSEVSEFTRSFASTASAQSTGSVHCTIGPWHCTLYYSGL